MSQPRTDLDHAREDLARQLGAARLRQALRKVQDAKALLDDALSDLSTLLGGTSTHQAGCKVSDKIHAYYYTVAALRDRLQNNGGPRVDSDHVDAELKRLASAAPSTADRTRWAAAGAARGVPDLVIDLEPQAPPPWKLEVGGFCLAEHDAKRPHMLMLVVGEEADDRWLTRYVTEPEKVYLNAARNLHSPAAFGVDTHAAEAVVRLRHDAGYRWFQLPARIVGRTRGSAA